MNLYKRISKGIYSRMSKSGEVFCIKFLHEGKMYRVLGLKSLKEAQIKLDKMRITLNLTPLHLRRKAQ